MSKARDLVLAAVKQGVSDPKAIATWVSVPINRVHTELGRLSEARLVHRFGNHWHPGCVPALTEAWR